MYKIDGEGNITTEGQSLVPPTFFPDIIIQQQAPTNTHDKISIE